MAAAAIVMMKGGTLQQSIGAASLALQNSLGLICDPIGNRVEAPCLGRNVMAATNVSTLTTTQFPVDATAAPLHPMARSVCDRKKSRKIKSLRAIPQVTSAVVILITRLALGSDTLDLAVKLVQRREIGFG